LKIESLNVVSPESTIEYHHSPLGAGASSANDGGGGFIEVGDGVAAYGFLALIKVVSSEKLSR